MAPRRPFNVDPILTAIAIGYANPAISRIADEVMPRTNVGAEDFKYTEYPIGDAFQVPDARVGRRGQVQQLEFGGEEKTASVEDYGLDVSIPYSDIRAADEARARKVSMYDPEGHSVAMLTETMLNIREVRVAQMVHNPASYAAGRKVVMAGGSQFSDYENSDPIGAIKTGIENTLVMPPNTMVMGRSVWSKVASHPGIVNAIKGNVTGSGIVTRQQFLELFAGEGITNLLIGDAYYNTAKKGQPVDLQRAWGKHISLLHINPMANTEGGGITWGLTAQYGDKVAGRIEDPDIGLEGGVRVRSGERLKELIVAPDVGYFIQNAVT
ncbi:MAG: capsid protein [Pseudomonadota bacterium]